jgi:3-phosphoshikimate 1-carboxyvinyltransferase
MTLVRRAARPMLASMFLVGGLDAVRDPGPRAKKAEKLSPMLHRLVPQLPDDTELLVRLNGAAQITGGLAFAAGIFPRLTATGLAVSLVPTTLAGHRFWEEQDPAQRRNQRLHFIKNVGLLGGLLLATVDTEGQPGLAWRARRATDDLQHSTRRVKKRAEREATMTTGLWPAPTASGPVRAKVRLPGSKSITNRALVLGALATSPLEVVRPLVARDTLLMITAIKSMGATVVEFDGRWVVQPGRFRGPASIDCGLAGTIMRFVPPMAGLADGRIDFDGDVGARARPMAALLDALHTLGVRLEPGKPERLPFAVLGSGAVPGGSVTLDASASSQFVSGLLLSGARYDEGVVIHHDGKPLPSRPHVEMTVAMLRERGVLVDDTEPSTWRVVPGPIAGGRVVVEPDLSGAAPFLAAALVTGGEVTIEGWPARTTQPGDQLRQLLELAGAHVRFADDGLVVTGAGRVRGFDVDLHDVGELTPVLAALASVADGPSYLRGIGHLRGHETDRLRALADELSARGAQIDERIDGLAIRAGALRGGIFRTYGDHRMVMAAAVLGLAVPGLEVENAGTVGKTMPDFIPMWRAMLAGSS